MKPDHSSNAIRWPTPNKTNASPPNPDSLVIAWKPIIDGWDIVLGRVVVDSPDIYTHWLPMLPPPDNM